MKQKLSIFPMIWFSYLEGEGTKPLSITINTERLQIRTVTMEDAPNYQQLFEDPIVMGKYATGQPTTDPKYAVTRIEGWISRWKNNDPFNGMAVFDKKSKEFVGHIVIGRSGTEGVSELAYLFHSKFWNQKLGTEAVKAVVNHLAPAIIDRKMLLDGVELKSIVATTRVDHLFSQQILRSVGMDTDGKINEKFGAQRYIFEVSAQKLLEIRREQTVNPEQQQAPTTSIFSEINKQEKNVGQSDSLNL